MPQHLVGVHQRLGVLVGTARSALDEVAGDRERSARERQDRHRSGELVADDADRFGDVRDVVGLDRAEALEVDAGPDRALGHRPGTGRDVDAEPDGMRRHDDVAVEHRRIDAVAPHRLQGDLGGDLGPLDGVEDRTLTAHGPVLREAAARLAHEPHRSAAAMQSGG